MSEKCTQAKRDTLIKVEENRRKAIFRNPRRSEYHVTEIDGCLVHNGPRADYLITEPGRASVLVELKGSDVSHACDQLLASAEHEKVKPLIRYPLGFLVICSKFPRFDTYVRKAKQKCATKYKAGFHVICNKGTFDINRVAAIDGPF